MTTLKIRIARTAVALAVMAVGGTELRAQAAATERQAADVRAAQRPAPRAGRAGAPVEANIVMVQNMVDAWTIVEAQKQLDLTDGQYPEFVTRMTKLQGARRRFMADRQRLLRELRQLLNATPRSEEAIADKVRSLDELAERSAQELRPLAREVDGVLNSYQQARFRLFEEQIERQKLDMLVRIRMGRGGAPPAVPGPGGARR